MRLRSLLLASSASVLALAVPAGASAAQAHGPHHDRGLTIAATPSQIIAGEGVMVYGQLSGTTVADQTIKLYHRIAPNRDYTLVGSTTTNSDGFYDFTRAEGVVQTNRSWYVRAPALDPGVHSKTIHEKVAAEVSLNASTTSADTQTPIVFSGAVSPNHRHDWVYLQTEAGATGTDWKTRERVRVGAGSAYSFSYRFKAAGDRDIRVLFKGDARNTRAASDPVTVTIEQAQVADFTINSSSPTITYGGGGATISGVLYGAGTTTVDPGVSVTLWSHTAGKPWKTDGLPQPTGTDGSYSFAVNPAATTVYEVRTTAAPARRTAPIYLGVHDVVTLTPSTTSTDVGQKVTFSGTVSPDKAHSAVYLERMGADGYWQVFKVETISHASTYSFSWTPGRAGSAEFRVRVPSDPNTLGGFSAATTITVALPPVSTLPQA